MKNLSEYLFEAKAAEKLVLTTNDIHQKIPNRVVGYIDEDPAVEVVIKDINLDEWEIMLNPCPKTKIIRFENCSGEVRFDIRKFKNLEYIDFGDCKDSIIVNAPSYFTKNPKCKMKPQDWPRETAKDKHGNEYIQVSSFMDCPSGWKTVVN
jgi:hypothetical protein